MFAAAHSFNLDGQRENATSSNLKAQMGSGYGVGMSTITIDTYHPNLKPGELDAAISGLVQAQRRCEWLLCRYLADMADGRRYQRVGWFADVYHYAQQRFGLGVKVTRERVRIGRALRELPAIEQAFVAGRLSYSKVRELTRVARPDDERDWLRLAELLPMRQLEQRVAGRLGGAVVADAPAQERWRTSETVEVRLQLPAQGWALLQRAMQAARQVAEASLTDAGAIEAVAQQALAALCRPDATAAADPRRAVVLYQCRECGQSELDTGAGAVALSPTQAEQVAAGAKVVDLESEGQAEATADGAMPAAVRRAVLARDRGSCRLCGRRKYVDIHHLRPRSRGGEHRRENCVVLCSACHAAVHDGKVRVSGNAEAELEWRDAEGRLIHVSHAPIGASLAGGAAEAPIGASTVVVSLTPSQVEQLDLSDEARKVLQAMAGRTSWHPDHLLKPTGLDFGAVSRALFELAMADAVREGPVGHYSPAWSC